MRPGWLADGGWAGRLLLVLLGLVLLVIALGLAASIGEMRIPLETTFKAISNGLFGSHFATSRIEQGIIWDYRLSRALMAACCGGSLALAGAILQALLGNPLAEPYILGVSAGASTGAVAILIVGLGGGVLTLSSGAFIGAIAAVLLVAVLASGAGGSSERIILAGVAASQLFNALTSYVVTTFANAEEARGVMFWLLGSLGGVRWPDVYLGAPVALLGLVVCLLNARALDAFSFGADAAAVLGVAVGPVRILLFTITAAMTACMVAIVGSVGFVGLVIPHVARFLVGPLHGRMLPACLLIGALFMVLADILSRVLIPQQVLPIGVVTALFGAPAFAWILYRAKAIR